MGSRPIGRYVIFLVLLFLTGCGSGSVQSAGPLEQAGSSRPTVFALSPKEVKVGEELRITGGGFGSGQSGNLLTVGGAEAEIVRWSDAEIRAVVPAGASGGAVKVVVGGMESNSAQVVILWTKENPENVPLSTAADEQTAPQAVSDGAGGAIVVWQDRRSGTDRRIYSQRVDQSGAPRWTADGVPIAVRPGGQRDPQLASDGAGGAIIVWQDDRNGPSDLYAQRVDGGGAVRWTADGLPVSAGGHGRLSPQIVSDGAGGAIVAWIDLRNGKWDLYAQRIDGSGALQWAAGDVAVSTAAGNKFFPRLISDGGGGAVALWQDQRNGSWDLYAQRIDGTGRARWTADGVPLTTAAGDQLFPQAAPDGAGGAIVVWQDNRSGKGEVYAERIDGNGTVRWGSNGAAVSTGGSDERAPQIVSDGAGGAILAWQRLGPTDYNVLAQRVNENGLVLWRPDGVPVSTAAHNQMAPELVSDGAGGAIVAWQDDRSGSRDLYAQRVDGSGNVQWNSDGVALSTAPGDPQNQLLISDGAGGAVIVWEDSRNGTTAAPGWDLYAQGISAVGKE